MFGDTLPGMDTAKAAYARGSTIANPAMLSQEPAWRGALVAAEQRSLVTEPKLMNLYLIIRDHLRDLPNQNVVEFGSYRGGSVLFMATLLKGWFPHARIFSLDTFEGMPETSPDHDRHKAGDFANADLDGFKARAEELVLDNIVYVKGRIEHTFPELAKSLKFGLAHIDVDIYSAVKFAQDAAWPTLVPGGYLIYDDPNHWACHGAAEAAVELMTERGVKTEQVDPHWVIRKP